MKKLNSKGITTIEVLLCFAIVVIITSSMYSTISSFNQKRIIEQYKEEITNYKNVLTKTIQDDFIRVGLTHVEYKRKAIADGTVTHTLNATLKDGTERVLTVTQRLTFTSYHIAGTKTADDNFMISYGVPANAAKGVTADIIDYPLPDLGQSIIKETGHTAQNLDRKSVV